MYFRMMLLLLQLDYYDSTWKQWKVVRVRTVGEIIGDGDGNGNGDGDSDSDCCDKSIEW